MGKKAVHLRSWKWTEINMLFDTESVEIKDILHAEWGSIVHLLENYAWPGVRDGKEVAFKGVGVRRRRHPVAAD